MRASNSVNPVATTTASQASVSPPASVTLCGVNAATSAEVRTSMPRRITRPFNSASTSDAGVNVGKSTYQSRSFPPSSPSFSRISGSHPSSASRSAVCMPATPPPITITRFMQSGLSDFFLRARHSRMS